MTDGDFNAWAEGMMQPANTDAAGYLPALGRGLRDDGLFLLFLAIAATYFAAAVAMTDFGMTDFTKSVVGLFALTLLVAACLRVAVEVTIAVS